MRILLIGSGGREHALAWKISRSKLCEKLYCAPGNGGISEVAEPVALNPEDIGGLLSFAVENRIDLTVVGPEGPLVAGIVDTFREKGLRVFGPEKALAMLEGSKVFAKELMRRYGVPTADFAVFTESDAALAYLETKKAPLVVKADGLCAGKGVVVAKTLDEARSAVKMMMVDKVFGKAGQRVIIEECLVGEEASIIVVSDGKNVTALASSQDHKRVYDHDKGPNTGGMGAYSPAPVVTDQIFKDVMDKVIRPVIDGIAAQGTAYKGVLYAGIMLTSAGPMVLEFNVRFGDPETQAIMPRLESDLVELMERSIDGRLGGFDLVWDKRPCVSVVMASGGYPGEYDKGMEIRGLEEARAVKDVVVFHAGTKLGNRFTDGKRLYLTSGGRVLNVTALGRDINSAVETCYDAIRKISFDRMHYRKDIGHRALVGGEKR